MQSKQHNLLAGIPEDAIRFTPIPNEQGHNAVWDFRRSPDGRFFLSVCGENLLPLSAILYEYYPTDGRLRKIFDVDREWIVDREQMPPSKVHTSIDFLPDGRLIMATHNTAPAPGHPRWMFDQCYEDLWQGYPGSIVMLVDPDSGDVRVRGIPVPRESIYGGLLDDNPRYYYFLGYMRGHFYRLDLETNCVKDYGKVTEFGSFRLIKDRKGRIYGNARSGELWRYDPASDAIEDLKIRFRSESPYGSRQFAFGLLSPGGSLFLACNTDGDLIELNPETLAVKRHGFMNLRPKQPRNPKGHAAIGGLEADGRFRLYYGLETYLNNVSVLRLVRWDILHGKDPENLGLIAYGGKVSYYDSEMLFDATGRLHIVDVCGPKSPFILTVKAEHLTEPGPDAPPVVFKQDPPMVLPKETDHLFDISIQADRITVLPLHNFAPWHKTAIHHAQIGKNGNVHFLAGSRDINLLTADFDGTPPGRFTELSADESVVSCVTGEDGEAAAFTSKGCLLRIDLAAHVVLERISLPRELCLGRLHLHMRHGAYALSGANGGLFCYRPGEEQPRRLEGAQLASPHARLVPISDTAFLFSNAAGTLMKYDLADGSATTLRPHVPKMRGRGFRAIVTGGVRMDDGTIVCGTEDGVLFTLSPDPGPVKSYGRLFSNGCLREFILAGNRVMAIYGGPRDAGRLVAFSPDEGLLDLGRPRHMENQDTETAHIHEISRLLYSARSGELYVASGEQFGCIIRYRALRLPTHHSQE